MFDIDFSKDSGVVIKDTLFGANLEHTRSAVYQGLSAQMLRNRKFAGKPQAHYGEPAEWYRLGSGAAFISLDPTDPYVRHEGGGRGHFIGANETNALVIQNPLNGERAGIAQKGLSLTKGKEYMARIILSCRGKLPFDVTAVVCGDDGIVRAEKTFEADSEKWKAYEYSFVMSVDETDASFEISFTARAEMRVGAASLMPADNFHGMRKDIITLMKEIGVSLLRWPGGNFSGEYLWKDALLDVDMRAPMLSYTPVETQPHSGGYDFHEIGVDDFIALCREIGAEPYLTVNLAWNSPEESAQWVEYCNGSAGTEWGKKRSRRGYAEPYNVKYWSLGNEFGYGHMEGLNTPEAYAKKARLTAEAMKKIDPGLLFFSSGPYFPGVDTAKWTEQSLPLIARDVSFISFHAYQWSFVHGADFVTDKGLEETYNKVCAAPSEWLSSLKKLRAELDACGGDVARIAISFDEWNCFFAWYHNPCVIEGIFTALMLEMFCKEYASLNMPVCMYFQPVNEGMIMVYPGSGELTANGQVLSLMKEHRGGKVLEINTGDNDLRCLGSVNREKGKAVLTVINRSYNKEISCLPESPFGGSRRVILLDGSLPILHGSKFRERNGFTVKNGSGGFIIPPRSILHLEKTL